MADPQVNPNALGAPTEGFGQTVSFAFDPRGVTPSMTLAKGSPGHGIGVSGASRSHGTDPNTAIQPVPKEDGTVAFLMRMGKEILAPKIEEARNAKFVEGVQKAMQGEAIKDMAEEQPWYSRIFGDTPMMEGARAYEVTSRVNKVVAEQTANMEKLRELGPDDAAKHFANVMKSTMTGDPSTDVLVSKHLIDAMPGLMKAQAKEHYGWGQKRAMDAMSKNMDTSFQALQQAGEQYSQDYISEADMEVRRKATVASILPPEGINEENYAKVLAGRLKGAADKGQFHAVEAVRQSGGFAVLNEEQRNAVERSVEAAARKHRNDYAFRYIKEIAEIKSDAAHPPEGMTPQQIADRFKTMNDAYRKLTGSPQGLFTSDEVADALNGTFNAIKAEEAKAAGYAAKLADTNAKASEKAAARLALDEQVEKFVANGQTLQATYLPGVSKEEVDLVFMRRFRSNPEAGMTLVQNAFVESGYVNPLLKSQLLAPLRGSEKLDIPSDQFRQAVQIYSNLKSSRGSTALAAEYFGDYAPKLEKFLRMTEGFSDGSVDARAYRVAFGLDGEAKRDALDKKERVSLAKTVAKRTSGILPQWLGGHGLRNDTIEMLADLAEQPVEEWRGAPGMSDAEAMAMGIQGVLAGRRAEVLGGFAIDRGVVDRQMPTVRELANGKLNVPADKVDDYFKAFLATKGVDGSGSVRMHYQGVVNGTPRFIGTMLDDGTVKQFAFTGAEWQDFAGKHTLKDTKPENGPLQFGPKLNGGMTPPPGMPSIYSGREEWARYRAEQEAASRKRVAADQPK